MKRTLTTRLAAAALAAPLALTACSDDGDVDVTPPAVDVSPGDVDVDAPDVDAPEVPDVDVSADVDADVDVEETPQ